MIELKKLGLWLEYLGVSLKRASLQGGCCKKGLCFLNCISQVSSRSEIAKSIQLLAKQQCELSLAR